ncbi:hypothetical protein CIB95_13700 [Lottiidibacillus patelloidae]|uniref:Uncharacterized protein n=1 Tax=Lottiidibacillus patelloidae TaxID=2670334 RepID=A0A263BR44_9BACI|nr:hypothetical protein [Lottiidibacillus patelloidae]OZM56154.1 hypothetical protein CIB95_13700 [Lottiidibacillus patelloidae]
MSYEIYHECCRYIGKPVEIYDRYGEVHRGVVERVSETHVFFRPLERDLGGFSYGYGDFGRGFGFGFGVAAGALALAAVVSIAAYPFGFFW